MIWVIFLNFFCSIYLFFPSIWFILLMWYLLSLVSYYSSPVGPSHSTSSFFQFSTDFCVMAFHLPVLQFAAFAWCLCVGLQLGASQNLHCSEKLLRSELEVSLHLLCWFLFCRFFFCWNQWIKYGVLLFFLLYVSCFSTWRIQCALKFI